LITLIRDDAPDRQDDRFRIRLAPGDLGWEVQHERDDRHLAEPCLLQLGCAVFRGRQQRVGLALEEGKGASTLVADVGRDLVEVAEQVSRRDVVVVDRQGAFRFERRFRGRAPGGVVQDEAALVHEPPSNAIERMGVHEQIRMYMLGDDLALQAPSA
jgi:hypothetical protein